MLELQLISTMDKVFPTGKNRMYPCRGGVMLKNEQFSFQAAFRLTGGDVFPTGIRVQVVSAQPMHVQIFEVRCVPCERPALPEQTDALRRDPGFFPDALMPLTSDVVRCIPGYWKSLWLLIDGCPSPGHYRIGVTVQAGSESASDSFSLEVLPAELPDDCGLLASQWLHGDCIAQQHGAEVFSERWWTLVEQYLCTAAHFGLNTILTPIFTPPLDTAVGSYRTPVQLVEVTVTQDGYRFFFSRLERWVCLCRRCGMTHFELSHLFTQWGAKAAPQILAVCNGTVRRLFGWEDAAQSPRYQAFLAAFLPELYRCLLRLDVVPCTFLHISDEPEEQAMEQYAACVRLVRQYLPGVPILDAMSSPEIWMRSGIDVPVVALDHMDEFLPHNPSQLWGYYCWVQHRGVSNRFFSMPSAVCRIFGIQAYLYGLTGFLHWGYNFYNSQLSSSAVDPWQITDAGGAFPGGDCFSVYPAPDGCLCSIRLLVFAQALEDYRALRLLEQMNGRDAALRLIARHLGSITWTQYPRTAAPYLAFRQALDRILTAGAEKNSPL